MLALGGQIGYGTGDPLRLLEDMQLLKPNVIPAVPRVLNRIFQAGQAAAQLPGLKGALFKRALETKMQRLKTTGVTTHALWDRLVFSKVDFFSLFQIQIEYLIFILRRSKPSWVVTSR